MATDDPALGELYTGLLKTTGFRVRQVALGPETMHLAWKRSFSLAIIECHGRLNLAIEIAVAVRFRSRRAPLILFGTGAPAATLPDDSDHLAPIRFMPLAPNAPALVREVRRLLGIGDREPQLFRQRPARKGRRQDRSARK